MGNRFTVVTDPASFYELPLSYVLVRNTKILTFIFLLTFFLDKKSNKKIKPVRKGIFSSLEISAGEPAPGTRAPRQALGRVSHACFGWLYYCAAFSSWGVVSN